jgi:hypothetical protein
MLSSTVIPLVEVVVCLWESSDISARCFLTPRLLDLAHPRLDTDFLAMQLRDRVQAGWLLQENLHDVLLTGCVALKLDWVHA